VRRDVIDYVTNRRAVKLTQLILISQKLNSWLRHCGSDTENKDPKIMCSKQEDKKAFPDGFPAIFINAHLLDAVPLPPGLYSGTFPRN